MAYRWVIVQLLFTEIMAVTLAIELAYEKGWIHLWLCDSLLVIRLLMNSSVCPPWILQNRWVNCLDYISHMDFRFSHAFREINMVADCSMTFFIGGLSTPPKLTNFFPMM